jgi:hypothetical protein
MKNKKLFLIPIVFVIIAAIASILSFLQDDKLEEGYIHSNNSTETANYSGDYFAVIGNVKDATHVTTLSTNNGVELFFYDENAHLLESYTYQIFLSGSTYDASIITINPVSMELIDDLEEYLFSVELVENEEYVIDIETITGDEEDPIDIILVTLDGQAYIMKQTMENVVYTSLILGVTSLIIVALIVKLKED